MKACTPLRASHMTFNNFQTLIAFQSTITAGRSLSGCLPRMSTPRMSIPKMSTPKISRLKISTSQNVNNPKCQLLV